MRPDLASAVLCGDKQVKDTIRCYLSAIALVIFLVAVPQQVYAVEWVPISGQIQFEGTPLCALVLANGQHMFSCNGNGAYNLTVPLDANGTITLYAFASGFSPFKQVLTAGEAAAYNVGMVRSDTARELEITQTITPDSRANWVKISGTVQHNGAPLCAMALANGQHMFTCGNNLGRFSMDVPLDSNGEITLYNFVSGFSPSKKSINGNETGNPGSGPYGTLHLIHGQQPTGVIVFAGGGFIDGDTTVVNPPNNWPGLDQCILNIEPFSVIEPEGGIYLDAGPSLLLTRGDGQSISLARGRPESVNIDYFLITNASFYKGGQTYSFSGTGGADVEPFKTPSVIAPPPLNLITPMPATPPYIYSHNANQPLALRWNGNNGAGEVEFVLPYIISTDVYTIICRFTDDGSAEIPSNLLSQVRNALQNNPSSQAISHLSLARYNFQKFEMPQMPMSLYIRADAGFNLELK